MLPIPGTGKVAHLEENTTAASIDLSDEDLKALGRAALIRRAARPEPCS